jgi:hypothetical protein
VVHLQVLSLLELLEVAVASQLFDEQIPDHFDFYGQHDLLQLNEVLLAEDRTPDLPVLQHQ